MRATKGRLGWSWIRCSAYSPLSMSSTVGKTKSKVFGSLDEAIDLIRSGDTILCHGFDSRNVADSCLLALARRPSITDLHLVTINADLAIRPLLLNKQIKMVTTSLYDRTGIMHDAMSKGSVSVDLTPLGTLIERCRAGAHGMAGFYAILNVHSETDKPSSLSIVTQKESRLFDGKTYTFEKAINARVAFVRASRVDQIGNCAFDQMTANSTSILGICAQTVIVEADELVSAGSISPDEIGLSGHFVNFIYSRDTLFWQAVSAVVRTDRPFGLHRNKKSQAQGNEKCDTSTRVSILDVGPSPRDIVTEDDDRQSREQPIKISPSKRPEPNYEHVFEESKGRKKAKKKLQGSSK